MLIDEALPEVKPEGFANPTRTLPEVPPKQDPEVPAWVTELIALDYQKGAFSQEAIARIIGKTSATVRQTVKALQQAIPRHALTNDDGITELGKTLILRSQNRGEVSMARWITQLTEWLGAIPETRQWAPLSTDDAATLKRAAEDAKEQAGAIELRAKGKLAALRDRLANVSGASDDLSEADIELQAQTAYEQRLDLLIAKFEAERKADEDFERMKRELGA